MTLSHGRSLLCAGEHSGGTLILPIQAAHSPLAEEAELIEIPEYFKAKARRQFGAKGSAWIDALPGILSKCIEEWRLEDLALIDDLSINFLCYASSPYGNAVLKICGPHPEGRTESTALSLYNGRHVCRCLSIDEELGAKLLERIEPGDRLRCAVSVEEQLRVGAQLIRDLPIAVESSVELPRYGDWIEHSFGTAETRYRPSPSFLSTMEAAASLFTEIPDVGECLLHGDLHHDNILLARDGSWKVIDPQGVIGAPVLECGRFIENHVVGDDKLFDLRKVEATVDYVSEVLSEPKRVIWIAFLVLHTLSFSWGFEMNYPAAEIERGADECAAILAAIPS